MLGYVREYDDKLLDYFYHYHYYYNINYITIFVFMIRFWFMLNYLKIG
jgi:hypothetical protein